MHFCVIFSRCPSYCGTLCMHSLAGGTGSGTALKLILFKISSNYWFCCLFVFSQPFVDNLTNQNLVFSNSEMFRETLMHFAHISMGDNIRRIGPWNMNIFVLPLKVVYYWMTLLGILDSAPRAAQLRVYFKAPSGYNWLSTSRPGPYQSVILTSRDTIRNRHVSLKPLALPGLVLNYANVLCIYLLLPW